MFLIFLKKLHKHEDYEGCYNGLGLWASLNETQGRLTKGLRLLEIFKLFPGSPINVRRQIGILSLANQGTCIKGSNSINSVQLFLHLYFSVPLWALLFVPARLVGTSIIEAYSAKNIR